MGLDILAIGEALCVLAPSGGTAFRRADCVRRFTAGAEVNVAVAAARLGLRAGFVGRVGGDIAGEGVIDDMRREGLDVSLVRVDPEAPTGVILRESTPSVARVDYLRSGSAGSRLQVDDIPPTAVSDARAVHVSGVTAAISESARRAAVATIERARDCGVLTSFDINYRSRLWTWDEAAPVMQRLAFGCDLLIGGADEMDMAFGSRDPVVIREATQCGLVIVTDGGSPVSAADSSGAWQEHVVPASTIDVVGAGDALAGGILTGLLAGLSNGQAVRQGVRCGSAVVQSLGDWSGLPWGRDGVLTERGSDVRR